MSQAQATALPEAPAIIASENFILATRETGYRDVGTAVAELIDNALQARARAIRIFIREESSSGERRVTVAVLDDGAGMDANTLRTALQFGGSNRFDERTGLGRFGMGLPNSSVSQTRRFDVYSWQDTDSVLSSYLDVDEVASGKMRAIPAPVTSALPEWAAGHAKASGTLVVWTRCDRLGRLKASTIARHLGPSLGRLYRYALWSGVRIIVNDVRIEPIDPLFLHPTARFHGASAFGSPMQYEIRAEGRGTAVVEVRFSELPVLAWHGWSAEEKRKFGIVGGAGVSIVRAGREIDYGWYFMGAKRRENYDDWWRCEIRFSPELDELFGVTHSKQGIRPTAELRSCLERDLEAVARQLNSRVRTAFEQAKSNAGSDASSAASVRDQYLPPPAGAKRRSTGSGFSYRIDIAPIDGPEFYSVALVRGTLVITLNTDHPFFVKIYKPAVEEHSREQYHLECLILAAARADLEARQPSERDFLANVRRSWADALAAFLEHA